LRVLPVSYLKDTEKIATAKLLFYRIEKFPERQLMDVGESASDKNKDFVKTIRKTYDLKRGWATIRPYRLIRNMAGKRISRKATVQLASYATIFASVYVRRRSLNWLDADMTVECLGYKDIIYSLSLGICMCRRSLRSPFIVSYNKQLDALTP